jgi:hypothetical protein
MERRSIRLKSTGEQNLAGQTSFSGSVTIAATDGSTGASLTMTGTSFPSLSSL